MGIQNLEYPKQPYSTVKRYDSRATYALQTIHEIINTSPLVDVSFNVPDSPFPAVIPMIGQMGSFSRPSASLGDVLDLYIHGYVSSRMMNVSRKAVAKSGDEGAGAAATEEQPEGLPVTVAASHVDGYVLSLSPFSHSYNYRSAVLFGYASPVTDPAEALWAMELITDGVVAGRWRNSRVPPTAGELQSTTILRVRIASGSAKVRSGMPGEEKADLADDELRGRVWTGVVPLHTTIATPMPAPTNRVEQLPAYLGEYVKDFNDMSKETALTQAEKPMAPKVKHDD